MNYRIKNTSNIDVELDRNTILRFNQTLSNYLKVSFGNDTYILTKYEKIHLIDVTEIRAANIGLDLLPRWRIINLNKNNNTKIGNFIRTTKTNSPTG